MKCYQKIILLAIVTFASLNNSRIKAEPDAGTATMTEIENVDDDASTGAVDDNGDINPNIIGDGDDEALNLEDMTIDQLEEICTSRGFDVVKEKDETTGEDKIYTHEEYVTAAQQCLEIESEMEALLSENPGLIDEIEAEAERMKLENARLEKEIADLIADNSDNEELNKLRQEKESVDGNMENYNRILDAHENMATRNNSAYEAEVDSEIPVDENDDVTSEGVTNENESESTNTKTIEDEEITKANTEEIIDLDAEDTVDDIDGSSADNTASTDASNAEESEDKTLSNTDGEPPFTIAYLVNEVRAQMVADFNRVVDLILPERIREQIVKTLKPIVSIAKEGASTVIDMVKRYMPKMSNQGNSTITTNAVATK